MRSHQPLIVVYPPLHQCYAKTTTQDDKERDMVDTTKTSNSKAKPADSAKDRALDSMLSQIERQS